uniref:Uncharacterized protein n=1 Tax=Arundo donax TaxID=35708 RepID=A0A0A9FI18_ARUDO
MQHVIDSVMVDFYLFI